MADPSMVVDLISALMNAEMEAVAGGILAVLFVRGFELAKKSIAGKTGTGWAILRFALSVLAVHRHTPPANGALQSTITKRIDATWSAPADQDTTAEKRP